MGEDNDGGFVVVVVVELVFVLAALIGVSSCCWIGMLGRPPAAGAAAMG
jgi:hypothetical protein